MNPAQLEYNLFIRRWQARLCIASFTSPAAIIILMDFVNRRSDNGIVLASVLMSGSFLFAAAMLQAWCFGKKKQSRAPRADGEPRQW